MALDAYKNLTESELVFADHCAEIGDWKTLAKYRELSESRNSRPRDDDED